MPRATTAEDLVRYTAFLILSIDVLNTWNGPSEFPKIGKALGIDVKAIVDRVAPVQTSAVVKNKKRK